MMESGPSWKCGLAAVGFGGSWLLQLARGFDQDPECLVYRFRVGEPSGHVGLKQHDVCPLFVLFVVLA
ncbi:MAG: hypothetical protein DMG21_18180, partial [Acidobacteria bacterium]